MVYHVHIYTVGRKPDTAFHVLKSDLPIDKIYLLNNGAKECDCNGDVIHDYQKVEDDIRSKLNSVGITDIVTEYIDPFDYNDIFDKVLEISEREINIHSDVRFHINFTMGTNIMAGAVCSAAYSINADLYYIQEGKYTKSKNDELIQIAIENIKELEILKKKAKTKEIFERFRIEESISNSNLKSEKETLSDLSYHTKLLKSYGLIKKDDISSEWILTNKGKQTLKRL